MKQFLVRRWFLLALACVLTIGFLFATQLQFLAGGETGRYARMAIVAGVLFLMSFPLGFGRRRVRASARLSASLGSSAISTVWIAFV